MGTLAVGVSAGVGGAAVGPDLVVAPGPPVRDDGFATSRGRGSGPR